MTTIHLPGGGVALLFVTPLHRRRAKDNRPYLRPTDWIAQAADVIRWGRTRHEAVAKVMRDIGTVVELRRSPPIGDI
jgi:hypothetical protein